MANGRYYTVDSVKWFETDITTGTYQVEIKEFTEADSKFPKPGLEKVLVFELRIIDPLFTGRSKLFSVYITPVLYKGSEGKGSNLYKMASAILKRDIQEGEKINVDDLIGKEFKVKVEVIARTKVKVLEYLPC